MKKNLPYFLVIAALIFLIVGVLSSGGGKQQPIIPAQDILQKEKEEAVKEIEQPKPSYRPGVAQAAVEEKLLFDFEENFLVWEIPDWCFDKENYVGGGLNISTKFAKEGKSSLELLTEFTGKKWTAAYVEVQEYFDWTPYKSVSADVFLPEEAPFGLQSKLILTVGEDWKWTEMSRLKKLVPGEWTRVSASLIPSSIDWRRTQVNDEFRADVRKLGIRIESNMRPLYKGPVYVDNVSLK